MLTGLRGVGKTVLLRRFREVAESHGWVCQSLEAGGGAHFAQQISTLAQGALLDLTPLRQLREVASRTLGVLRSFQLSWAVADGGTVTLGVDPVEGRADSRVLQRDLADLLGAVARHANDRGKGVVITIDEIQYLSENDLRPLIMGLHQIGQQDLPLLVVGAGLPSLLGQLGEARSYAERLFAFVDIGSLDTQAARRALVEPAEAEGATWDEPALQEILTITQGYPYFLQEFGRQAWHVAPGPRRITLKDVQSASPTALAELDAGFFRVRTDRTTDGQWNYLRAMAGMGPGPYRSGDVARAMKKKTTQVGTIRQSLIEQGICYSPRHDVIAFTVPMFDEFINRNSESRTRAP